MGHKNRTHKNRRRLFILFFCLLAFLAISVTFLIRFSTKYIKTELEQALGDNVKTETVAIGWGSIHVKGLVFMKDGEISGRIKQLSIRPDFLSLLKRSISVSSLYFEEPYFKLQIKKDGQLVIPISIPESKKQTTPDTKEPMTVKLKKIYVKDGKIDFEDKRPVRPTIVQITNLKGRLDNLSFPLKNNPSYLEIQAKVSGTLLSGFIKCKGHTNFKTGVSNVQFNVQGVNVLDEFDRSVVSAEGVSFHLSREREEDPRTLLSGVIITRPHFRIEVDKKGEIAQPVAGVKPSQKPSKEQKHAVVAIKDLQIRQGTLLYLDGKVSQPAHSIKIDGIESTVKDIDFPPEDKKTSYTLSGQTVGKNSRGAIAISGITNLKSKDTTAKIKLKDIDLTTLRPYIENKGDLEISNGFLTMNMDLGVLKRHIHAPGTVVLRDLQFKSTDGFRDVFLGVPRSLVMNFLKTGNNEIVLDFTVEGDLDNPKFNIRESLLRKLTVGLAGKVGLSVKETGESLIILGGKGIKETTKTLKKGIDKFLGGK